MSRPRKVKFDRNRNYFRDLIDQAQSDMFGFNNVLKIYENKFLYKDGLDDSEMSAEHDVNYPLFTRRCFEKASLLQHEDESKLLNSFILYLSFSL